MTALTTERFEAAEARGKARPDKPRAQSAHYDAGRNRVIVRLSTGIELGFAPGDVEGLQAAVTEDLKAVEVEELGLGIHFPTIDVDLYVPALLEGILGSKRWMATQLGAARQSDPHTRQGGCILSERQARWSATKSSCRLNATAVQ